MLQYYERENIIEISLNTPFEVSDVEMLETLFLKRYFKYELSFNNMHTLHSDITMLLYHSIFVQKKNIVLTSFNSKLTKYLHRLGFNVYFVNLMIKTLKRSHLTIQEKDKSLYKKILNSEMSSSEWFSFLLDEVEKRYSYDFRLYKLDMVKRRVEIFLIKYDIATLKDAVPLILFEKSLFEALFFEISINVTEFFRNPVSFYHIKNFIDSTYKNSNYLKIWSVGCSSGEEAYSLAMLLDDAKKLDKSLIYATDFNRVVLENAKSAIYSNSGYNKLYKNLLTIDKENYIEKYIIKYDNFFTISEKIRKKVLFLEHNLIIDTSFNEFDIIICKNVLIYFDETLQRRVFTLIYDSLRFGGHLILGESERLSFELIDKFHVVNSQSKIYKKVA
jgi:chemotaxis protein methyltransferase CheR